MLIDSSLLPGVVLSTYKTALSTWAIDTSGNGRERDGIASVSSGILPASAEF
jgi:hypothetical protein